MLAERYDALPAESAFADVHPLFPEGGLALDVGAGSGRDARWLKSLGFDVVAVEPARHLRLHGERGLEPQIRWIDDRLPSLDAVHRLALSFDLITISAVWQHVAPGDRPRAFRKLVTLLRAGGVLALTLRTGPSPADRPMHPTSAGEIEGLARTHGMEVVRVKGSDDLQGRAGVTWTTAVLRLPDDGSGALPLVRGIVLADEKSSTYKLGLLRAVARIAELYPAAALPAADNSDAVELPLGLAGLFWTRLYLPLVRHGVPQAPRNRGPDGLGFAKSGFRSLLHDQFDALDLRVGALFDAERSAAVRSAISEAVATITTMPANFIRFPNSGRRVFQARRGRPARTTSGLDLDQLRSWGALVVPGSLWRALSRFGPWIEPMLISEWGRLSRGYAERMGATLQPGVVEALLEWREPVRSTAIARLTAERLALADRRLECVWSGKPLTVEKLDVDHYLPWTAFPCGDLWNLGPCDPHLNRHEKRDRLPSAAIFAESRSRIIGWWEDAYLADAALGERFMREASAALPIAGQSSPSEVFEALEWRRLRLLRDQHVPEWVRAGAANQLAPG